MRTASILSLSVRPVIAFAVAGLAIITMHGDTGVFLLVAALVVAAPAAAASRYRSYH